MSKKYRSRTALVRSALILLAGWGVYSTLGQSGVGTLRVEIDGPAMVCITSLADNTWRTPPDGRIATRFSTVRDFHKLRAWKPGDAGPVRSGIWGWRIFTTS